MQIQRLTVQIPLRLPADLIQVEQDLQQRIQAQVGDHALVRWAITRVQTMENSATVEAVVSCPP